MEDTARTTEKILTIQEVATVADVPRRYVDHMLEAEILPDAVSIKGTPQRFRCEAAFLVAMDAHCKDWLTPRARKSAWQSFALRLSVAPVAPCYHWEGVALSKTKYVELLSKLIVGPVRFEAGESIWPVIECTALRYRNLIEADDRIISDPEILSGTPVIKGTRIPAHDVAASVEAGISNDEILESYPSLKAEDIEIACIWANAHPSVGRPRRRFEPSSERVARKGAR